MPIIIDTIKEGNIEVNNLNEILVVNGPGSFTGIRIGVTIAKTLAYSLNIPIKVLSSLLIKAISVEHNKEITIVEKEKNGVFVGIFDKGNNLLGEYKYLSNQEYKELAKPENEIEDIKINYSKIIEYSKNIKAINPHSVNPLYVKKIEVQK
jgi:tRNA threonylcarbamoyladenosine biosynthesis protein TsaB